MDITEHERAVLERLDGALRRASVRARIDELVAAVTRDLEEDAGAAMAWRTVPLALYGDALSDDIRSSWVFLLRRGVTTGAERHPDSRQRMLSYSGRGDFPVKAELGDPWSSNPLRSDGEGPLEERWISIPPNCWHQGVVGPDAHWAVVSFQTAAETELIEERPDPEDPQRTVRKLYVPPHA